MALFGLFKKKFESVSPTEALARIEQGAMLLDVRESVEYQAAHAPAAKLISLGVLPRRLKELPKEREMVSLSNAPFADRLVRKFNLPVTGWRGPEAKD